MIDRGRESENDWTGWIIPGGALLIAGALLAWTIWPRGSETPAPSSPVSSPLATAADPHIVIAPGGTFSFGYEDGAIVIRELDGVPRELGRVAIAADQRPNASGDFTAFNRSGNAIYALVCPSNTRGIELRMIFGYTTTPPVGYSGPPATGGFAPDGMWLFVLDPGALSANAALKVESGGTAGHLSGASMPGQTLIDARTTGVAQPSGCWVVG